MAFPTSISPGLLDFHRIHGKLATMTAVRPPARFGHLELDGDQIAEFSEKPQTGEGWINGAFFVSSPRCSTTSTATTSTFEKEPLERLAKDGQLMAYRHHGFWQCMDTIRDKKLLRALWDQKAGALEGLELTTVKVLVTGHDGYIGHGAGSPVPTRRATRSSGSTAACSRTARSVL